jgi:cell division protein FtsI/penicillin-binding protein 2
MAARDIATVISPQQEMLRRRLPVVIALLGIIGVTLIGRMVMFQAPTDPRVTAYVDSVRQANYATTRRQTSDRGIIYDRTGERLAVNIVSYRVGISANLVADPEKMIQDLSIILGLDPLQLDTIIRSNTSYALLATNVQPEVWAQLAELKSVAIVGEAVPSRYYPQGALGGPLMGFVAGAETGVGFRGYNGVEGNYEDILAGRTLVSTESTIPLDLPVGESELEKGSDLVLTIDRDVQFLVEQILAQAIADTGASGGTILVMNPNTGDILAMASYPTFDPNNLPLNDARLLRNPAISDTYEPGSVMKIITMASALERGAITPDWVYVDEGSYTVGGRTITNWDQRAHGVVDAQTVLVDSLNIGTAKIAVEELESNEFYEMISAFGFGLLTRVDMQGEAAGILRLPGDERWSEADLGANSYGQGMSVTPLQMLNAANAIANGGLLLQPRIVSQIIHGNDVVTIDPVVIRRVISERTALQVTEMMVAAVNIGLDESAQLPGYTIAGKTGTADIPSPVGYVNGATIATFIGFLPADEPQVSILVKLDQPKSNPFASQTAAPVFRQLAERLVTYLEIPTDAVRMELKAAGGIVREIRP